jgi:CubicO group peptidase (beta-lactamase class C family)
MDYVMRLPIKWSPIGLIIDGGKLFGNSKKAFGHTGSGGSIAFADPERKLSISYTSNTLSKSLIGDKRAIKLVSKFYELF